MLCLCESGFSVYMTGPGVCVLYLADTGASEMHPVFNTVAPYGYLLHNMNLFIADITKLIQTRLCDGVGPGSSRDFVRSRASHPACPHGRCAQKNGKSGLYC